jgi:hypothetical protein
MRDVMVAQQVQTERLSTAIEAIVGSRNQPRPGTISDFMRLNPSPFSGEEKPLDAEQWLVDMENRLTAARILDADKVDVVKIQLIGIARQWWLAEENHLARPITWKSFSDSFLAKFFPDTVKDEMEKRFINLE